MKVTEKIEKMAKRHSIKQQIRSNEAMIRNFAKMYVRAKHSGFASERAKCAEIESAISLLRLKNKLKEIQYELV